MDPIVIIHGGAYAIPDSIVEASLHGVQNAAKKAWDILSSTNDDGGETTCLDAVEAAITILENDPTFDAGTGSVLTLDGQVELDAMIMDGRNLNCGSIACAQNIRNPIQLARLVMDRTDHAMLVGKGANDFALEHGIEVVGRDELVTPEAVQQWELYRKYNSTVSSLFSDRNSRNNGGSHNGHDTVGCVVMDKFGNLACGTSTGGITAKRSGRVGDSPIIGSGGYADNETGAVSCTGHGESILKVCLAKRVADGCGQGMDPTTSLKKSLKYMADRVGGAGGAICIDRNGNYGFAFNTERMAWSVINKNESICGINPDEIILF